MIYYGYTDNITQDPPKTLLLFKGDNLLDEVEKSLYNTLIQVPLHHFHQVFQTLAQHSNSVATTSSDPVLSTEFTYIDISDLLLKVKSQIIGELRDEC